MTLRTLLFATITAAAFAAENATERANVFDPICARGAMPLVGWCTTNPAICAWTGITCDSLHTGM